MQPKLTFKEDKVMFLSKFFKIHVTNDSTRIAELPREQGYMPVVTWAALQFHIKVTFLNWRSFCVGKGNPHVYPVHLPTPAPEHQRPPCSAGWRHSSTFATALPVAHFPRNPAEQPAYLACHCWPHFERVVVRAAHDAVPAELQARDHVVIVALEHLATKDTKATVTI